MFARLRLQPSAFSLQPFSRPSAFQDDFAERLAILENAVPFGD
jgi:hypothetical protein